MELNKIQIKIMRDIEDGVTELPKSHDELYGLVFSILKSYDHEELEKPLIEKCISQFIKISLNSDDVENWVYLSGIRNILRKRNYYKKLKDSMKNRGVNDPTLVIATMMISEGLLMHNPDGVRVAATLKAENMIEEKENEMRNLMREARLAGKLEI